MRTRLLNALAFLLRPWSPDSAWPWVGWGALSGEFCTYAEDHGILDDPCNSGTMPWDAEQRALAGHGALHGGNGWEQR